MVRDAKGAALDALWLAEVSILSLLGQMPAVASRDWGTLGGGPNMCEFDVVVVSHTPRESTTARGSCWVSAVATLSNCVM